MTEYRDPDAAPEDILQQAFVVPEHLTGTRWEPVYNEILERMTREANGLAMGTVQNLLMERIARFYVDMRHREEDPERELSIRDQKEFNSFWLSMTVEFNKQLKDSQDKLREALLLEVQGILLNRLNLIKDEAQRKAFRRALQEDFSNLQV